MVGTFPFSPIEDLADQLATFFESWTQCAKSSEDNISNSQGLDAKYLDNFFNTLAPAIGEFHSSGAFVNVWEISGVGFDELRNSKILSWFLDRNAEHGLATKILTALVNYLHDRSGKNVLIFPNLTDVIDAEYSTIVESCPFGEKESRIDIEIDGEKFLLFVEVKINAAETGNQLDRYVTLASKKSNGRLWGVIFLTPTGRAPSDSQGKDRPALLCKHLLCMSWAEVSAVFLTVASAIQPGLVRAMLTQYAKFIKTFRG